MPGKPVIVCSHPRKLLEDHLLQTLRIAEEMAAKFNFTLSPAQKKALFFHDIGKAHPFFQARLCKNCPEKERCDSSKALSTHKKIGHAESSGALVFALTEDIFAAEAVRCHHTGFSNIDDVLKLWQDEMEYTNSSQDGFYDQSKRFYPGLAEERLKMFSVPQEVAAQDDWSTIFPDEKKWGRKVFTAINNFQLEENKEKKWLQSRYFYSLLVAADRWEAVVNGKWSYSLPTINPERVDEFIRDKKNDKLFAWRNAIRKQVLDNSRKIINSSGIYTLTLPTGSGKTLTGLEIAMDIADRFNATGIIYVLPFISLVEQNAQTAAFLFQDGEIQEDHYLAYTDDNGKDVKRDETASVRHFISFFRYWKEPVVVTTFSKFWEVLFSPRANKAMSFHRLSRAVVILDEVQSIPPKYWSGLGSTLSLIAKQLESIFILMTATQPKLVSGKELSPGKISFPKTRYQINWLDEKMTVPQAIDFLMEKGIKSTSTLITLNTRRSALEVYAHLLNKGIRPCFLSTWVTPIDRIKTLKLLQKKEKNGELRHLVATQVVEAGMDLDFDMVFRDFGPLDSIVQVAGRCNRHSRLKEAGKVYVARLISEESGYNYSRIYDQVLLKQTHKLLSEHPCFDEKDVPQIVERYYRLIQAAIDSAPIWENISEGYWGEYYPIIEEKKVYEGMLVIDKDGKLEPEIKSILDTKKTLQNAGERRTFFRKLSNHTISVPLELLEEWYQEEGGMILDDSEKKLEQLDENMWLLRPAGINKIYSPEFGFIPPDFKELISF